jgi:hypothetical protein
MGESRKLHEILADLFERLRAMKNVFKNSPAERQALEELSSQAQEIETRMVNARIKRWEEKAGENTDMLTSPELALAYFEHLDPQVRIAATSVASERWPSHPEIAAGCERLALDDPDEDVRAVAVVSLGVLHSQSGDDRISRVLARIVRDETSSINLRRAAYAGLLMIQGIDLLSHEPPFEPPDAFPIPDGIDWGVVNRFVS